MCDAARAVRLARALLHAGLTLTALVGAPLAAVAADLTGVVVDERGAPREFAAVTALEVRRTAVTDAAGRFVLHLPQGGRYTVQAGQIGYRPVRVAVSVPDSGQAPPLRLVLVEAPIPVAEVAVRASSFGQSETREGSVLQRTTVYRTPGAAADLMQAAHTLPGVHAPNEGAAIYVRGGDPSETLVRFDGGDVGHPYRYENASGGLFGMLDASLVASAFFSSGGFAPRYGNALSGVLDVETTNGVSLPHLNVGANFVGGGGTATVPLVGDRLGVIVSGHASDTGLLVDLYGSARTFVQMPHSSDAGAKLVAHTSRTGTAHATWLSGADRTGVLLEYPTFVGAFHNHANVDVWNAGWRDVAFGRVALRANAAGSRFRNAWNFSAFDYATTETQWTGRAEGVWPVSSALELSAGADGGIEEADYSGHVPGDSTDYAAGAPTRYLSQDGRRVRAGLFADDKVRLARSLYATLGGRIDRYGTVHVRSGPVQAAGGATWTTDPRAALAWSPWKPLTLRLAGGGFHEAAPLRYTDARYGNPAIGPLAARHWIAGAEWKRDPWTARLEAYRKDYTRLVLNDSLVHYSNGGDGYASGADLFVEAKTTRLTGWISYGYIRTERHELQATERVPSPYAPLHDLTLVATYHLKGDWDVGAKARWAAGARYTPVAGAAYDSARAIWRPIDGPLYSGVYPDYARLDIRVLKLFALPRVFGLPAATGYVYLEGLNALGIRNILEYRWSPDYATREPVESYFSRRLFVLGGGINW